MSDTARNATDSIQIVDFTIGNSGKRFVFCTRESDAILNLIGIASLSRV